MNNKEVLGNAEAQNENASEWDNQDFPEFNSAEKQEQVDVVKLAEDLVRARKDMREGATWDKEQRAYIGEDGLPRDWAHLVGYLRRNPDAIKTATETLAQLQAENAPAETSAEEPALETEEASAEIEEDVAETEEANVEIEEDAAEIEEDNSEIEEDTAETEPKPAEVTPINRVDKTVRNWKHAFSLGFGIPEKIPRLIKRDQQELIKGSNERIQAAYALREAKQERERAQAEMTESEEKLDRLPLLTLPWSKNGKEKRALRRAIKEKEQAMYALSNQIDSHAKYLKENELTEEDKTTIETIDSLTDIANEAASKEVDKIITQILCLDMLIQDHNLPDEEKPSNYERAMQNLDGLGLDKYEGEELEEMAKKIRANLAARKSAIQENFKKAA